MEYMDDAYEARIKSDLRRFMMKRLADISACERNVLSALSCGLLREIPEIKGAKIVLSYMAMPSEIDTVCANKFFASHGVQVAYPVCMSGSEIKAFIPRDESCFKLGKYEIMEPDVRRSREVAPADISCVLVPGLAFCAQDGRRLGRGCGYYDRFLKRTGACRIGMCFDCQIIEDIPFSGVDVRMNYVVTSSKIFGRM